MKKATKIIIIALSCVIASGGAGVGVLGYMGAFSVQEPYPYVFVHGLNGWGTDKTGSNYADYWGATAGDLMKMLEDKGVECYAPSVGEWNSAWDRACELYAQLTGATVDYGEAHSSEFGHERYGKAYGEALIPDWGLRKSTAHKNARHKNARKINLVGHSFGGASVRVFAHLMAEGSEAERTASGAGVSPLFEGGKGNMVFSVTALAAPHNGTTLLYAIGGAKTGNFLSGILDGISSILNGTGLGDILGSIGISLDGRAGLDFDEMVKMSHTRDNAYYDLTLEGAGKINGWVKPVPGIYYFSYPYDGTRDAMISVLGNARRVGSSDMSAVLQPLAAIIGGYGKNTVNNIAINDDWLPNDGLVNTISAKAPFDDGQCEFSAEKIERGVWNVMPVQRGDHGKAIGLFQDRDWLVSFYMEQINRINKLSERDWR
ncbi:MAG: hypothetical protein FWF08_01975 [Oscillospiraceae bacterium]|nr:hypothetical protein [Oscillospiraceae bacterium]